MKKRAQLYIIAAIILILVVVGAAGISNYLTAKDEPTQFYDLGGSLGGEVPNIIDFGIYNDPVTLNSKIDDFISKYSDHLSQTNENFSLVIVYGNQTGATQTICQPSTFGGITTDTGAGYQTSSGISCSDPASVTPAHTGSEYNVMVPVGGNKYNFELHENEDFMFVMASGSGSENFVYKNK